MTFTKTKRHLFILIAAAYLPWLATTAQALDLEPRRWSHLPLEAHFFGLGSVTTNADIAFDPALQLEQVEMDLQTLAAKYIYSFESFGKSARIDVTQAYQQAQWNGLQQGVPAQTSRQGLSDTFVRYAINLYGAPPLKAADYVSYRKSQAVETIIGAGLALRLPTGDYQPERLLNLGQNRLTIRPQLGLQHNRGRWTFEANTEVAFFTDNTDFFNGKRLEQQPILIAFASAAYTYRPGLWVSVGYGGDYGGESTIDGVNKNNRLHNSGWAINAAYPLSPRLGLTLAYIETQTLHSTGLDSQSLAASLAIHW